jgi:hypothetical protein
VIHQRENNKLEEINILPLRFPLNLHRSHTKIPRQISPATTPNIIPILVFFFPSPVFEDIKIYVIIFMLSLQPDIIDSSDLGELE